MSLFHEHIFGKKPSEKPPVPEVQLDQPVGDEDNPEPEQPKPERVYWLREVVERRAIEDQLCLDEFLNLPDYNARQEYLARWIFEERQKKNIQLADGQSWDWQKAGEILEEFAEQIARNLQQKAEKEARAGIVSASKDFMKEKLSYPEIDVEFVQRRMLSSSGNLEFDTPRQAAPYQSQTIIESLRYLFQPYQKPGQEVAEDDPIRAVEACKKYPVEKTAQIEDFLIRTISQIAKSEALKLDRIQISQVAHEVCQTINTIIQNQAESQLLKETAVRETRSTVKKAIRWAAELGTGAALTSSLSFGQLALAAGGLFLGRKIFEAKKIFGIPLGIQDKIDEHWTKKDEAKVETFEERLTELTDEATRNFTSSDHFADDLAFAVSGALNRQLRESVVESLKKEMPVGQSSGWKWKETGEPVMVTPDNQVYWSVKDKLWQDKNFSNLTDQQKEQAINLLTLTLTQEDKARVEAEEVLNLLRETKPKAYNTILKFKAGQHPKKPHHSLTMEDFWVRARSDLISLSLGATMGLALDVSPYFALAAIPSVGDAYKIINKGVAKIKERPLIKEMTARANRVKEIVERDSYFINDQGVEELKFVQEQLALGLLDSQPMLKEKAENFIRQARQFLFEENGLRAIDALNRQGLEKSLGGIKTSRIQKKIPPA